MSDIAFPVIRLSVRQHELLYMDSYCEYSELNNPFPELSFLRSELRAGRVVSITPVFVAHVSDLADRDADLSERLIYRRLWKKVCIHA